MVPTRDLVECGQAACKHRNLLLDKGGDPAVDRRGRSGVTTHIPPGRSNGWTKIDQFEGLYGNVQGLADGPVILTGDFNAPQRELPDGRTATWGERDRDDGTVCLNHRGERWRDGEWNVPRGLEPLGIRDTYRAIHGGQAGEGYSWVLRREGKEFRRRFDHVLASQEFEVQSARYLHEAREESLSDHSPLLVELAW